MLANELEGYPKGNAAAISTPSEQQKLDHLQINVN